MIGLMTKIERLGELKLSNFVEEENQRLREELEKSKKSDHEKSVAIKLLAFIGLTVAVGLLQEYSMLGAGVLAALGFWFLIMRDG